MGINRGFVGGKMIPGRSWHSPKGSGRGRPLHTFFPSSFLFRKGHLSWGNRDDEGRSCDQGEGAAVYVVGIGFNGVRGLISEIQETAGGIEQSEQATPG